MATTHNSTEYERKTAAFLFPSGESGPGLVRYFDADVIELGVWGPKTHSGTFAPGVIWAGQSLATEWTALFQKPVHERVIHLQSYMRNVHLPGSCTEFPPLDTSTTSESPTALEELRSTHVLRDERAVLLFLDEHSEVLPVLLEGRDRVSQYFGLDASVELDVVEDPESDGYRQMFARIVTSLGQDDVERRLDRFDEEWFLGKMAIVGDLLCYSPILR